MIQIVLHLEFSDRAFRELESIARTHEKLARIIREHLGRLPTHYHFDKQLKGSHCAGIRSHRVGDYRILYRVEHDRLVILVIRISHRKDVYEG